MYDCNVYQGISFPPQFPDGQWHILNHSPKYDMGIQACVPTALCALHNFIQHFDADTFNDPEFDWDYVWFNENEGLPLDVEDVEEVVLQERDEMGRAGEQRDMIA
ncbi:hypothetical protein SCLCIDRAFT_127108 [Scleroderma citrinum Foug A]|uniref:Uncharacterized protein n=1 Tax=Scleroderma citrinum Foug A TaxID=1036808 RepID=A0A0C3DDZ1_9AGAM|nr:hypothetical protein SCLCIDRAFT_127108 [Scleroderma citrinum Foug A]